MSKFNVNVVDKRKNSTQSYEDGRVYSKSLENSWTNMLFSSILQPQFYETSEVQQNRFIELTNSMIEKHGCELIGKAAIFSRNELGMRSISELLAAILNGYNWEQKRNFYSKYFRRPDGVGEVFAAIDSIGGKRSHAFIRGCSDYLSSLSDYQLAKYPLRNHKYNMHDLINLTHANSETINKFQRGELASPETWEVLVSSASCSEDREKAWKYLVEEKKLGYLALLRNLRNICSCSFASRDWITKYLIPQIEDNQAIRHSLVWPIQIYTAWKVLNEESFPISVEYALSNAFLQSTKNIPELSGNTLIVLDVSGSMENSFSKNGALTIKEVCAVYASAFLNCDFKDNVEFIKFGEYATYFDKSRFQDCNVFAEIKNLSDNDRCGYSTRLAPVFDTINKHYDRILLFSDMQVMDSTDYRLATYRPSMTADQMFKEYCEEFGRSHIYSFDLGNYSTQVTSSDSDISYVTALNDIVFKLIAIQESGRSLLDVIRDYSY